MEEVKKAAKDGESREVKEGFFKGVKREFYRISWPLRKDIVRSTTAVVAVCVVIGALISVLDVAFSSLMNLLMGI